jgi:hypothetical protein
MNNDINVTSLYIIKIKMARSKTSSASASSASASASASTVTPVPVEPVSAPAPAPAPAPVPVEPVSAHVDGGDVKKKRTRAVKVPSGHTENPVIAHSIQENLNQDARVVEMPARFVDYALPSTGFYHSANRVKTSFVHPMKRSITAHRTAISHAKKFNSTEFPKETVEYLEKATASYMADRKTAYENTVVSESKKDKELAKALREALASQDTARVLALKADFYTGLASFRNALDGKSTCEVAEFLLQRDNVRISSTAHYSLTAFVDVVMVSLIAGSLAEARKQTSEKGCTLDVSHISKAIASGQPLMSGFLQTLRSVSSVDVSSGENSDDAEDVADQETTGGLPNFASYIRTIARDLYRESGDSRKLSLKVNFRVVCSDIINEMVGRVSSVVDVQRDEFPRTIKSSRMLATLEALTKFSGETEWVAMSKKMSDAVESYLKVEVAEVAEVADV